ncbi:TIGR02808 family protein [Vibrio sp. M260118]
MSTLESVIWHILGYGAMPFINKLVFFNFHFSYSG